MVTQFNWPTLTPMIQKLLTKFPASTMTLVPSMDSLGSKSQNKHLGSYSTSIPYHDIYDPHCLWQLGIGINAVRRWEKFGSNENLWGPAPSASQGSEKSAKVSGCLRANESSPVCFSDSVSYWSVSIIVLLSYF